MKKLSMQDKIGLINTARRVLVFRTDELNRIRSAAKNGDRKNMEDAACQVRNYQSQLKTMEEEYGIKIDYQNNTAFF